MLETRLGCLPHLSQQANIGSEARITACMSRMESLEASKYN
jgi:hypothetical protein